MVLMSQVTLPTGSQVSGPVHSLCLNIFDKTVKAQTGPTVILI